MAAVSLYPEKSWRSEGSDDEDHEAVWRTPGALEESIGRDALLSVIDEKRPDQGPPPFGVPRNSVRGWVILACLILLVLGGGFALGLIFPPCRVELGPSEDGILCDDLPEATPPPIVFSVVWSLLFVSLAVSLWLLVTRSEKKGPGPSAVPPESREKHVALIASVVTLVVIIAGTLTWIPLNDGGKRPLASAVLVLAISGMSFGVMAAMAKADKWVSAAIIAPFATWCGFAAGLNFMQAGTARGGVGAMRGAPPAKDSSWAAWVRATAPSGGMPKCCGKQ